MGKFDFTVTADTQEYCEEIVRCLIDYGEKQEEEAVQLINIFWAKKVTFGDDDFRLHEPPYFWAMSIIHHPKLGRNYPGWLRDSAWWPPPDEFKNRWYGESE